MGGVVVVVVEGFHNDNYFYLHLDLRNSHGEENGGGDGQLKDKRDS